MQNLLVAFDNYDLNEHFTLFMIMDTIICANIVLSSLQLLQREKIINRIPWLYGALLLFAYGLGGTSLLSTIKGEPWWILEYDPIIPMYLITWTVIYYVPIIHKITTHPAIEFVLFIFDGWFNAQWLTGAIQSAVKLYPNRFYTPMLVGIIHASGSKILYPILLNGYLSTRNQKFATVFANPGWASFVFPVFMEWFYYFSRFVFGYQVLWLGLTPEGVIKILNILYYEYFWLESVTN
jgi:hypothetical protein